MARTKHRRRVPEKKSEFDNYQKDSTTHLETGNPTRAEQLGLLISELTEWQDYRNLWLLLYPFYTNPNTRTKTATDNVNDHMDNFAKFAEPLLTRMSGSAVITFEDRNILNLPARDKTPTRRGKIDDKPIAAFTVVGGGQMKVRTRTTTDASRCSMHPLSDLIECRYVLFKDNPSLPGSSASGAGIPLPEQAPNFFISKKAIFEIDFGTVNLGKYVVAFFRWVNASNPSNNGPWTLPVIGLIS